MVFGSLPDVYCLCLSEDKDIQIFKRELQDILERLDHKEPVAVLCDIGGGSPYNTALELLAGMDYMDKASVVSGMNLPLLLVLLMAADVETETVKACIAESCGSIKLFETSGSAAGEDEDL